MNPLARSLRARTRRARQSGFTIIEMMVALAIGLFIVIGFTASFVNMKTTFKSQDSLSQLQDNERLAMTMLSSSIQEAGYYPTGADLNASPKVAPSHTDRTELTGGADGNAPSGGTMQPTWYIYGTAAAGSTPQTLSTAYVSDPGDGVLTCQGSTAPASAIDMYIRNVFYVDSATNTFGCRVLAGPYPTVPATTTAPGSNWQPLISNVKSMTVLYGIDVDADGSVDSFLAPDQLSILQWQSQVKAVRITLTFIDPVNAKTNPGGIQWTQTINLMNNR